MYPLHLIYMCISYRFSSVYPLYIVSPTDILLYKVYYIMDMKKD